MRMRAKFVRVLKSNPEDVAERWKAQYWSAETGWLKTNFGNSGDIYEKLIDLGGSATSAGIAAIIGNRSWGSRSCDGCAEYCDELAEIGEYESHAYCATCLREALHVLEGK